jgi:hypothetical protein
VARLRAAGENGVVLGGLDAVDAEAQVVVTVQLAIS